jgi:hypothetical protein
MDCESMRALLSNAKVVRALASALMLITLFSLATFYALYTPPEPPIEASKLIILTPSFIGPMGVECMLAVQAVSDEGLLDKKRDDLVRISIDRGEHAKLGISDESVTIWSESIDLKLNSGQGVVRFVDHHKELVRISIEWLEGPNSLESHKIEVYIGWRGY